MKIPTAWRIGASALLSILAIAQSVRAQVDDDEDEALIEISDRNIPFIYETRADIPTPREKLVGFLSDEFRNARDEFTRAAAYERAGPVLEKRLKEASAGETFSVTVGIELPTYDFARGGFELGISTGTYCSYDVSHLGRYAVAFKPVSRFSFVSVSKEKAQELAKKLSANRHGYYIIFGSVRKADEMSLNGSVVKTVLIKPALLKLYTKDGTLIGEVAGQAPQ